jgi:hypothetical protein
MLQLQHVASESRDGPLRFALEKRGKAISFQLSAFSSLRLDFENKNMLAR